MHYLRVNAPRMVHEVVDGEVIVIDLATGAYYNLPGTASQIWQSIAGGGTPAEIASRVTSRFLESLDEIRPALDRFLTHLLEEELIVEVAADAPVAESADTPASDAPATFTTPLLEKYTDMAELILLDPVHDVSALGWPNVAGNEAGDSADRP